MLFKLPNYLSDVKIKSKINIKLSIKNINLKNF